jgi:hypothetical protein
MWYRDDVGQCACVWRCVCRPRERCGPLQYFEGCTSGDWDQFALTCLEGLVAMSADLAAYACGRLALEAVEVWPLGAVGFSAWLLDVGVRLPAVYVAA